MATERIREVESYEAVALAPDKPRKLTVFELLALDADEEQRLLDEEIDKVLSEGYEILEVTDLYEHNEAEE